MSPPSSVYAHLNINCVLTCSIFKKVDSAYKAFLALDIILIVICNCLVGMKII